MKYLAELKRAFKLILQNKLNLLVCSITEILFFVLYGFITAPIYQKLVQYTNIIGAYASEALTYIAAEEKSVLSILFEPSIKPYFTDIILLLILLGITAFLLYCMFQAFIWKTSLSMTGKKFRYLYYLRKFIKINIIWFLFFIVYYFAGFAVDIRNAAIKTISEAAPSNALHIVLTVYFVIFSYFAIISYVNLDVRKSFRTGVKKFRQVFPAVFMMAVYFIILHLILTQIVKLNFYAGFIIGLIIIIPSLTIARVYISLVIQKIK